MRQPRAIDLYAGLGGWMEGLLAAGYDVVGFDIERHVYGEQRYPGQLVLQDILTVHGSQFRDAALIVASPPCQNYSYLAMPWSRSTDPNNSKAAKALRKKWETEGPDNRLFDACFRIQREALIATGYICASCGAPDEPRIEMTAPAGHVYSDDLAEYAPCSECCNKSKRYIPLIVENVRGAVPWVGPAKANYGSFYLWGDVEQVGNRIFAGNVGFGSGLRVPTRELKGHGSTWFGIQNNGERYDQRDVNPVSGANKFGTHNMGSADKIFAELEGGIKIGGDWFSDPSSTCRKHGSRSNARKAASAMIAKIPLPLSRYIGSAFLASLKHEAVA